MSIGGAKRQCVLLLVALATGTVSAVSARGYEVLHEKQSHYHYVRVVDSVGIRTLTFRRKGYDRNQSRMDMSDPLRPCLPYYPLMFAGYLFVPNPRRILIVGLGAGVLSRWSAHYFPEAVVDSIELDPEVVEVARKFFGFQEGERQQVFIRDARVQIKAFRRQQAKYDIIMLDAFRGGYIPFHLTTKEFLEECREILSADGALVMNLKPSWVIYEYQRRTLAAVFAEQYPFGGASGSEVVVALPSKRKISQDRLLTTARDLQKEKKFSFELPNVVSQFDIGPGFHARGDIFTDGHAPANVLKRQMENPPRIYEHPKSFVAWVSSYRVAMVLFGVVLMIVAGLLRMRRHPISENSKPGQ